MLIHRKVQAVNLFRSFLGKFLGNSQSFYIVGRIPIMDGEGWKISCDSSLFSEARDDVLILSKHIIELFWVFGI